MSMNVGAGDSDEVMMDINTTPLIDVMLVLLIMLIITIPVQKHSVGLNLPVDQSPPPEVEPPKPVTLEIDFDGTLYWDGEIVLAGADLESRLQSIAQMNPQPEFRVQPNRLVAYKHVINVMAAAQRRGVTKMGVIGT